MAHKASKRDPKTYAIIGAAMEVHRQLGPGFLEAVYHDALEIEFRMRHIPAEREVLLPVFYKGQRLNSYYRVDFVCYDSVIVELKALGQLGPNEEAQIINYLKASGHSIGLLINFGKNSLDYRRFILSSQFRSAATSKD